MSPEAEPALPVVLLTLEYDGTAYVGWQGQPNGTAIQPVLEKALSELQGEPVRVVGAGRTDAGVHALGQRASFIPPRLLPPRAYTNGLNGLLPRDVAVRQAERRPRGFDARRAAQNKLYRYRLLQTEQRAPLSLRSSWQIYRRLDLAAMHAAVPALLGEHDFTSFRAAGCSAKSPVRTLRRLEIAQTGPGELCFELEARAFLRHMVRNLVGTLVEVGLHKRPPESIGPLLSACDRTQAGRTAPPQGLTLVRVDYPD